MIGIENVETPASAMQSALTGLLGALECLRDKEYPEEARQIAATRMMRDALERMKQAKDMTEVEIGNGEAYERARFFRDE